MDVDQQSKLEKARSNVLNAGDSRCSGDVDGIHRKVEHAIGIGIHFLNGCERILIVMEDLLLVVPEQMLGQFMFLL